MPTKNTIVVPCMVKRRLKTCGDSTVLSGKASCKRIKVASRPATSRKTRPTPTYMIPRRLWSTVTTHSCSLASTGSCPGAPSSGRSSVSEMPFMVSLPKASVASAGTRPADPGRGRQFHRRHERSRFERVGIVDPGAQIVWRVLGHAGREGRTTHQMRQIGPENTIGGRTADGMTVDTGDRLKELAPAAHPGVVYGRGLLRRDPLGKLLLWGARSPATASRRAAGHNTRRTGRHTAPASADRSTRGWSCSGSRPSSRPIGAPKSYGSRLQTPG